MRKLKEMGMVMKKRCKIVLPNLTVLHNIENPSVSPAQVLNIAPGERQIPVSFTTEPNCEALAFPKYFPYGRFHFGNTQSSAYNTISIHPCSFRMFWQQICKKSDIYLLYLGLD